MIIFDYFCYLLNLFSKRRCRMQLENLKIYFWLFLIIFDYCWLSFGPIKELPSLGDQRGTKNRTMVRTFVPKCLLGHQIEIKSCFPSTNFYAMLICWEIYSIYLLIGIDVKSLEYYFCILVFSIIIFDALFNDSKYSTFMIYLN